MNGTRFDWNLIGSFLAVLDAGTLSGAARQSGISQPTLGRHVGELEAQTGLVLFERGRAGMMPTQAALRIADEAECRSVAFPAISAGVYGWDVEEVACIALEVARSARCAHVRLIRFVLYDDRALAAFERAADRA